MAIDWNSVVGTEHTLADGGYVGDMLKLARAHIDDAVANGRLQQKDAGQVYTAMIPAAMQQGVQFLLNKAITEANIDKAVSDAEAAKAKSTTEYASMLAKIDKEFGYGYELVAGSTDIDLTSLVDTMDGIVDYSREEAKEKLANP